jgi:cysteine-rich repeat protein
MILSPGALSSFYLGLLLFAACTDGSRLRIHGSTTAPDLDPVNGLADAASDAFAISQDVVDCSTCMSARAVPVCGNGTAEFGEQCDDGNTLSGDGCSSGCQLENEPPCWPGICRRADVCGDQRLSAKEMCDDGNTMGGDGCSADCLSVETGWRCRVPGRVCSPICGDRLLKGGESCDDGNTMGGDGCSADCLVEPGWDCASGSCVRISQADGGFTGARARCGDGIVSGAEECDCGDHTVSVPDGCWGPNDDPTYGGCDARCRWGAFCGDGIVNGPEECDLANRNGTDLSKYGCTLGCTKPHYCGDGMVDPSEDCDLGERNGKKLDVHMNPTDAPDGQVYCDNDCMIPFCCIL